ncbi:MAG: caspase family protein [Methylococcales bacterium]|nr:caspase family protein [Methylococcales bacterium]
MKNLVLLALFFLTLPVNAGPKTALVIGNSSYKSIPLANPANDATDIANNLELLGFEVIHKDNLTRQQMRSVIREYGKKLKIKGGAGIFFYAGHGMQVSGKNYLIPIGANIQSEFEVPDESVEADLLLRALDDAKNPLNIIVLDACRDNPFARSFRSTTRGLTRMEGGTGTLIAYSTGPGNVAMDGEGRNSPYTKHLLKQMTQTGLSIEQVFKRVRVGVENDSGGKQTPWETSSLRGDFYFVPETTQDTSTPKYRDTNKIEQTTMTQAKLVEPEPKIGRDLKANTLMSNFNSSNNDTYKLTIYTNPSSAQVRILNLEKAYQSGMELTPGDYNIEISDEGYISKKQWVTIDKDHINLQVTLVPSD